MASCEFHHFGVPTSARGSSETFIEDCKVHVTDPESHPFRVEFLRFEPGSTMPEVVQSRPHAAFKVDSLDEAIRGRNLVVEPFDATDTVRVALFMDGDALIEVMEIG